MQSVALQMSFSTILQIQVCFLTQLEMTYFKFVNLFSSQQIMKKFKSKQSELLVIYQDIVQFVIISWTIRHSWKLCAVYWIIT